MKRILNWKLFLFTASLLLSSLSFVSCDPFEEDNSKSTYKELIIGKWGVTELRVETFFNGVVESNDTIIFNPSKEDYFTYTFLDNGKLIIKSNNGSPSDTADYYVANNDLYVSSGAGYSKNNIKTLNSSSLDLYSETNARDGHTFKVSSYFSRISK